MFSFTFLGSGTSQGVPIIGQEYPASFLANPKNHRTRPSLYIATPEVKLVIDTTPEFRLQILRENIRWLDARSRHAFPRGSRHGAWMIAGVSATSAAARGCRFTPMKKPLADNLRRVFQYAFTGGPIPKGYFIPEPHIIEGRSSCWAIWRLLPCPCRTVGRLQTVTCLCRRQKTPRLSERLQRKFRRRCWRKCAASKWPCWMPCAGTRTQPTCAWTRP